LAREKARSDSLLKAQEAQRRKDSIAEAKRVAEAREAKLAEIKSRQDSIQKVKEAAELRRKREAEQKRKEENEQRRREAAERARKMAQQKAESQGKQTTEVDLPEGTLAELENMAKNTKLSDTERQKAIKAYKNKLSEVYTRQKTVKEIEKPHKKITKVYINENGLVKVYMKVKHDWGGIFYFIEDDDLTYRNISKSIYLTETSK
ncbi:MAG TPA: hypothetical protein VJ937_11645, partial [Salinivirga sp.]|nr:hypothetical protein [Salinivirga sp.]